MEVMGLMLGELVDDYTVRVIDVFAMPQSGTVRANTHLCIIYPLFFSPLLLLLRVYQLKQLILYFKLTCWTC